MTVDDRNRLDLHRKLQAVLGTEEADTLMAHLPPVTWNEVTTKADLATLGTALRGEMHTMRTELRGEIHTMGIELRSEMQTGFATLRTEFVEGTNRQIKWLVTFAAGWTALLVTLVQLAP